MPETCNKMEAPPRVSSNRRPIAGAGFAASSAATSYSHGAAAAPSSSAASAFGRSTFGAAVVLGAGVVASSSTPVSSDSSAPCCATAAPDGSPGMSPMARWPVTSWMSITTCDATDMILPANFCELSSKHCRSSPDIFWSARKEPTMEPMTSMEALESAAKPSPSCGMSDNTEFMNPPPCKRRAAGPKSVCAMATSSAWRTSLATAKPADARGAARRAGRKNRRAMLRIGSGQAGCFLSSRYGA
mmetsp:Transcript_63684/g.178234  ORF Transcript_63684/g.178234 Transcript_63684/m.178234 type:complete len:244 (-) Transcript_63684:13-744(-)